MMRRAILVLLPLMLLACAQTQDITIAAWNLQIFGDAKAANPALMSAYDDVISRYDIIFLQEIRDADGSSIVALCSRLEGYACNASSRTGRTSSKEQYVIVYRNATLVEVKEYNPDPADRWERPPVRATFVVRNETIVVYAIHIKPSDASAEIRALEELVEQTTQKSDRVIVLGDLNADCSYYDPDRDVSFDTWHWAIRTDTTIGKSDCAYDRILLDDEARELFVRSGIDRSGITAEVSDHALVWVGLDVGES